MGRQALFSISLARHSIMSLPLWLSVGQEMRAAAREPVVAFPPAYRTSIAPCLRDFPNFTLVQIL